MTEEQVFLAALDVPDRAARIAYLDEACGQNGELRRQVEELLAAHERSGQFLDQPAAEQMAAGGPQSLKDQTLAFNDAGDDAVADNKKTQDEGDDLNFLSPSTRPDSLGRLGHYEVLQVLGKGGFGIVFRAFDDVLQRVVAVKVMAPQIATLSPARKRFLREARSSAQVRHENVVQVYEVGEKPLPFLTMEFIPGETLQQRLNRTGPLEVSEVLRIGRQIAEGLAAAHACDLIHRDIKPGNILLEGGSHKVKITDFGLARAADDASISQSGVIAGTPMYMAPEQALGLSIDQRADLFSLGSVLYQMVSGRPPFRASSTLAVLKRVADEPPRPIPEIIPETPTWLCAIIAKLHAKDPDDRYQSAREVADLLGDCEANLKANQQVKNVLPTAVKPARRKWVAAAAVLLLAVIALALTESAGVTHLFRGQQATTDPNKPGVEPAPDRVTKQESPAPAIASPPSAEKKAASRKLANIMDLTTARVLVVDDFNDPRTSAFGWGNWAWRFKDGRIVIDGTFAPSWGDTGLQFSDFVGEVVARTSRDSHKGWGLHLFKELDKDTPNARFGGVEVMLNSQGELSVLSGRWGERKVAGLPSVGPFRVAVYKQDEFNSLVVVFRGGRHLEVFVNGVEACQPITLPCVLEPAQVHLASMGGVSEAARLEFKSYKVWSAPPTPVPVVKQEPLPPFADADVQRIAALPAPQQVEEVRKELKRRNPGFDGKMETKIEGGVVTEFRIVTDKVTDIAPIRVFNSLRVLDLGGTHTNYHPNGRLADLSPLKGMNLTELTKLNLNLTKVGDVGLVHFKDCTNLTYLGLGATRVSDNGLAYFKNCKSLTSLELFYIPASDAGLANFKDCKGLTRLNLVGTKVSDAGLANFKDCKNLTTLSLDRTQVGDAGMVHFQDCKSLTDLGLGETKVRDVGLAHFKDCKKLIYLSLTFTQVGDAGLAQLKGMPLRVLRIYNTGITDLTPLQGMPLEHIRLTPKNIIRGMDVLRDMKSLETIGLEGKHAWPATEFWQRYDKGEFK